MRSLLFQHIVTEKDMDSTKWQQQVLSAFARGLIEKEFVLMHWAECEVDKWARLEMLLAPAITEHG